MLNTSNSFSFESIYESQSPIYNNISKKRILNELDAILREYKNIKIKENERFNHNITIYNRNKQFDFIVSNNYPFQPPIFKINNIAYNIWTKSNILYVNDIIIKYNCPCCTSIVNHWSPSYNMLSLIREFYKFKDLFESAYNVIHLKKIFNTLFPLLYHDDIFTKIEEFLF